MKGRNITKPPSSAFLVLGIISILTLNAAYVSASDELISSILVQGNKRVETEAIMADISSKTGTPLNQATVAEDIRRIYATGLFNDVKAYTSEAESGIALIFSVVERPVISKITIEGNDEIDKEDIEKALDIKPLAILDMKKVQQNVQKISDLYADKGFFLSEVTYRIKELPENNEVELTFAISEHAKIMVRKITLLGNSKIKDSEILPNIETQEGGFFSFITSSGQFKQDIFDRDLMRIQQIYRDRGYIKVKLGTPLLSLSADKKYLFISVAIDEGEQYRVGKIFVEGELDILGGPEEVRKKILGMMGTREGAIFNVSQFFHFDLTRVSDLYKNQGYAWVNINTPYVEHPEERTVDLTLDIQKGPLCYIEKIIIAGNAKTRDKVIRREMRIYEADLFSITGIERSKSRIMALGFFEKAEINYKRGSADNLIILDVEVKEKPTGTFQVGAGFSSVENFLFQAQVAQHNLFGRGQSLSLSAQISSMRKLFDLSFTEPYFLDSRWTLTVDVYNTSWDYYDFTRSSTGGRLTFGHPIFIDELTLYMTYNLETVAIESGQSIENQVRIKNLYERGITSSLTFKLVYDSRNNRILPSSGQFHQFSVETANRLLGSQNEFLRMFLMGRWYFPLPLGIIAKANVTVGYITAFNGGAVPISERFYVGGINSIRGYNLRSIAPIVRVAQSGLEPDSTLYDFYYGGNKELVLNLEIEFPIVEKVGIKGVIFADAGNSYSEDEFFFDDKDFQLPIGLLYSVGFGIRWFSPIGPLRFEWGFPLTRRPNRYVPGTYIDDTYKFEFTIGNSF